MSYLILLLFALVGCSAWEPHYDTVAASTNYQRGEDAMRRGELELAARLFDVYLNSTADPTYRPRAFYQSARAYYGMGQYDKVLVTLDEMEKEFPKERWSQIPTLRGDAEYALGHRTSAFLDWEAAWQRGTEFDRSVLRDRMGRAVGELSPDELHELQRLVTVDEVRDMLKTPLAHGQLSGELAREGAPYPRGTGTTSSGSAIAPAPPPGSVGADFDDDSEAPARAEAWETGDSAENATPTGPHLGALLALTGAQRHSGQQALRALRLAGGGTSAPVALRDTGSDPSLASQLFSNLARDPNLLAVIAPLPSEELAALAPLAEQLALPILLPPDYSGPAGRFAIRPNAVAGDHVRALVEYAFGRLNLKRFGVLYPSDSNGHARMELFQSEAVNHGATLVGIKGYSPGKSEFASEIAAVLRWESEGGLEALFIPDTVQTLTTLGSAIRARAPRVLLLGLAGWNDRPELVRAAAGLEGAIVASTDAGPVTAGLDRPTSPLEAQVFDATTLGRRALERGAKSRPEMLSQLRELSGAAGVDQLLRIHEGRLESVTSTMTES